MKHVGILLNMSLLLGSIKYIEHRAESTLRATNTEHQLPIAYLIDCADIDEASDMPYLYSLIPLSQDEIQQDPEWLSTLDSSVNEIIDIADISIEGALVEPSGQVEIIDGLLHKLKKLYVLKKMIASKIYPAPDSHQVCAASSFSIPDNSVACSIDALPHVENGRIVIRVEVSLNLDSSKFLISKQDMLQ